MIIVDLNQVMISNLMVSLRGNTVDVDENLIRHMILNSIRMYKVKFTSEFGDMVIACDDRNYWRKDIFPYYKASRKKSRELSNLDWNSIFTSLNKIRDELKEYFPYRVIQCDKAEADDVIGVICSRYGMPVGGEPILILSGDKDFQQLQKYANVQQFDPVRKRWLKCSDPQKFLTEHVLRGDVGDGIPNFLSSDDTFVSSARQKQLRQKMVDEIVSTDLTEDWKGMNQELLRNYNRNRMLIDLTCIPDNIRENILSLYDEQANKPKKDLFNYFIKNKLKLLTECISEF
jgi:hypothetical protein